MPGAYAHIDLAKRTRHLAVVPVGVIRDHPVVQVTSPADNCTPQTS